MSVGDFLHRSETDVGNEGHEPRLVRAPKGSGLTGKRPRENSGTASFEKL